MDWSHEFCLSCDRQISQSDHGAYCSQSCRLADLERASAYSAPSSYASTTSQTGSGSGFYLPPALNFSSSTHQSSAAYSPSVRSPTSLYPNYSTTQQSGERSLYSSPSRSSLSSLHSHGRSEPAALSDKVKNELREYAGSFDHIRDWKRRMTVV
ncbi:hypothetical protein BZA05DRAFT_165863 [Tricharina praecox]|uniref:uncharacterized protein n=1 Tax=Tricharina praecox TaxID=43433 RepID=UPI0022208A41|nr:uncharacterized protein BZA05DRAFT_165863 [Tricharina praecox]KAI5857088.1 hypothetical protein BZA05DRAFT_165863 [Tricharina praecox]